MTQVNEFKKEKKADMKEQKADAKQLEQEMKVLQSDTKVFQSDMKAFQYDIVQAVKMFEAAVELSMLPLRCQGRCRSVDAAVEVFRLLSRCDAAIKVSRLLSRC